MLTSHPTLGLVLCAFAVGLQNGTSTIATGALIRTSVTLAEQRARRAGSGRDTQVNPKPPPGRRELH